MWKRIFVGRPIDTADAEHTLLPKTIALPVFASDPLSSVAYATQEILLVLSLGGLAFFHLTPYLGLGVAALLTIVTLSYRQTIKAYSNGGGAYIVARVNLGESPGLIAGAALLLDYVTTVAVSIAAGVDAIISAAGPESFFAQNRVTVAIVLVGVVATMNLRGIKESGTAFAFPTYGFIIGMLGMITWAAVQIFTGSELKAETAGRVLEPHASYGGLALAFLALRAFSSGCTALTGVEAISTGVPAFRKPKAKNAIDTLTIMAAIAVTMFLGVTMLAVYTDVTIDEAWLHDGNKTVLAQIAATTFGDGSVLFYYIQAATAGILILAANTAFTGFPSLASILARDGYMPRQFANRGDRLVFSNGIVMLALLASILLFTFNASVSRLIQLYIVGVFVSFTLSQAGMVAHWRRESRERRARGEPTGDIPRSLAINLAGSATTALVLVIVLWSKFIHGAWIPVVAGVILFATMKAVNRHYVRVARQIKLNEVREVLPARNHAVVLVSSLSVPTLRALNYARSINAHTLSAISIAVDPEAAKHLEQEWERSGIDIPLVRIASPYRDLTKPLVDYVKGIRRESERDIVTVVLPEFVVTRWWEQLLHGQSALLIKLALLRTPGVVLTNVPWHLDEADVDDSADGTGALSAMSPGGPKS
ncbi:MAG TPA: APC family permease [Mycobacteriales bacterium]|jgi:amino acid transporter|nr:APC family permease [Mycobacteriales bacterium]